MKLPFFIKLFLIFLAYFLSGKFGLSLATVNESTTAIWAPTGIAIASLLLFGRKIWPIIFLAAFFTNITTNGTVITSMAIAAGNTLEGVIGAYLVEKYAKGKKAFDRPRNIFLFTLLAGFLATLFSATIGVTTLSLLGFSSWDGYLTVWQTWWFGDAAGALIVTPLVILWLTKSMSRFKHHDELLEAVLMLLAVVLSGVVVFSGILPYPYICIPVLMWAAFRFGQRTGATAVFLLSLVALWYTIRGFGPYVIEESISQSLLLTQAFLGTVAVTTQVLAALVSERKKVEERLQSTLNNMSEGFQIIGFDYKYIYVNNAVARQGRRRPEELIGHTMMEVYPGIENANFFEFLRKAMIDRAPHSMENEFVFPDGNKGWFNLTFEPVSDGVLILSVDITEQKAYQAELTHDKAEAEALLNSIGDGIIATDQDGKIIMVNKTFEELMGWKEHEIVGKQSFEFILMEDEGKNILPEDKRPLAKALNTGKKITAMHYLVRKNGTKFPVLVTATLIVQNGKITGAIEVFHDITREREIDEMKTEFISIASHELRTPLSAIKGFISMINKGDYGKVDKKLERPLQLVAASTERLINIVNEMLDVTRIEANRIQLLVRDVDVRELLDVAVSNLQPLISQSKIKLSVVVDKSIPKAHADQEKAIEILNNLISNALKFTEKGRIEISAKKDKTKLVIAIKDTGTGISRQDQAKLFNKFEQLKSKKAGNVSGTGLGLYISKEFARKMGGDVWLVESKVMHGSTFALSLPLANQEENKKNK
jgi:PAS domain S-box-containing protein